MQRYRLMADIEFRGQPREAGYTFVLDEGEAGPRTEAGDLAYEPLSDYENAAADKVQQSIDKRMAEAAAKDG